ncbi:MAG TPA: hypothetical protein ENG05_03275, partial [Acidilobales archaeon]|nr:hypothetical protein [Acidilobales archaeon]
MAPLTLGSRGGKGWFLRLLGIRSRKRIDKGKLLEALIVKIESSLNHIKENIVRLKLRYQRLIERGIKTLLKGSKDRALIYFNEA